VKNNFQLDVNRYWLRILSQTSWFSKNQINVEQRKRWFSIVIKVLYDRFKCKIMHRLKLGELFDEQTGIWQGCINTVYSRIEFNLEKRRVTWLKITKLENSDYADGICLFSHQQTICKLKEQTLPMCKEKGVLRTTCRRLKKMRQ
jgi:hypothetical protein